MLEEGQEVVVAMAVTDRCLDQLHHDRRQRHRDLLAACRRQPEVEILAQQLGGERRRPVQSEQIGSPSANPVGTQAGAVEKVQERRARDPGLLGQGRHFRQRLDEQAEVEVVTDLDEPSLLIDAAPDRQLHDAAQIRLRGVVGRLRTGGDHHRLTFGDHVGVAADRRRQELDAAGARRCAYAG